MVLQALSSAACTLCKCCPICSALSLAQIVIDDLNAHWWESKALASLAETVFRRFRWCKDWEDEVDIQAFAPKWLRHLVSIGNDVQKELDYDLEEKFGTELSSARKEQLLLRSQLELLKRHWNLGYTG